MKTQIRFGIWGRRSTATSSASEPIEVLDRNELIARIGQFTPTPPPEVQIAAAPPPAPQALWRRNLPPR